MEQDWTPVVLKKEQPNLKIINRPPEEKKLKNLESEEPEAPKTLGLNAAKQIQQARCAKTLTQEQLAQKLAVKTSVIKEYESGKVTPDRAFLNRLNRLLGIKIGY